MEQDYKERHGTSATDIGIVTAVDGSDDRPYTVRWFGSGSTWTYREGTLLGCVPSMPERTRRLVEALLKANSGAAAVADAFGRLPLHLAAGSGASRELVESLLLAYPAAVSCSDPGQFPLQIALDTRASAGVVEALLMADHGMLLREIVQCDAYAEVVFNVVKQFPRCANDSVYSDGCCAREAATSSVGRCTSPPRAW